MAARDYLVAAGIAAPRMDVVSYGKERPIDPGSNEEAWQRNRNGHTAIVSGVGNTTGTALVELYVVP
jgi:peptidoglycan-associated lipoprotein